MRRHPAVLAALILASACSSACNGRPPRAASTSPAGATTPPVQGGAPGTAPGGTTAPATTGTATARTGGTSSSGATSPASGGRPATRPGTGTGGAGAGAASGVALTVAPGPRNPGVASVAPGAASVVALQVTLTAASDVKVTQLAFTLQGAASVSAVELVNDLDGDGRYQPARDVSLGQTTPGQTSGTAAGTGTTSATFAGTSILVTGGVPTNLLALVSLSSSATPGSAVTLALDAATVVAVDARTGAATTVRGAAAGASVTVAAAPTPTSWRTRAALPTARRDLAVVTEGGLVHALGGRNATTILATHEAYDPTSDRWTALAPMPVARALHGAAELAGKLYVVGGETPAGGVTALVDAYDPATDSWSPVAPLPTALADCSVVAYQSLLWVTGGTDGTSPFTGSLVFDPAVGAWSAGPGIGTSTRTGAVAGGYVLLFDATMIFWGPGGPASSLPAPGAFAETAYVLWDFAPRAAAVAFGNRVYLVGGQRGGVATGEVQSIYCSSFLLQPATTILPSLGVVRDGMGVGATSDRIYAVGGADASGASSVIEELTR